MQRSKGSFQIYAVIALVIAAMGWLVLHQAGELRVANEAKRQVEQTLDTERDLRKLANKVSSGYQAEIKTLQEKSRANERKLRAALAAAPDCTLSGDAGGVLRDVARPDPGPTAGGPGAATAQADPAGADRDGAGAGAATQGDRPVSCAAVAIWAQRNIDDVLKPNAAQLQKLQSLYNETRERVNGSAD